MVHRTERGPSDWSAQMPRRHARGPETFGGNRKAGGATSRGHYIRGTLNALSRPGRRAANVARVMRGAYQRRWTVTSARPADRRAAAYSGRWAMSRMTRRPAGL